MRKRKTTKAKPKPHHSAILRLTKAIRGLTDAQHANTVKLNRLIELAERHDNEFYDPSDLERFWSEMQ